MSRYQITRQTTISDIKKQDPKTFTKAPFNEEKFRLTERLRLNKIKYAKLKLRMEKANYITADIMKFTMNIHETICKNFAQKFMKLGDEEEVDWNHGDLGEVIKYRMMECSDELIRIIQENDNRGRDEANLDAAADADSDEGEDDIEDFPGLDLDLDSEEELTHNHPDNSRVQSPDIPNIDVSTI